MVRNDPFRMDPTAEKDLVERARAGEAHAVTALLEYLYPWVRKHATFVLGLDRALVEDAVQESMVQIYRSLPGFRGKSSIKTWALRIASRTVRRHGRAQRPHQSALTAEGELDDRVFAVETTGAGELSNLFAALADLSAKKREAFILMEIFELSAREAGEVLRVSGNTAASRCRHARTELAARLGAPTEATPS